MTAATKKTPVILRVIQIAGAFAGVAVVLCVLLFGFLTIREYRPLPLEDVPVQEPRGGAPSAVLLPGAEISILTWNMGYGALGDNADFFMDGGTHVMTADAERVQANLRSIASLAQQLSPDVLFFQETDKKAHRSHRIDQVAFFAEAFDDYATSFARNFTVDFIPYPLPPIGQVDAGILTLSRFVPAGSTRIQLPCPFAWPVRIGNLKRCLLASRIPIAGTGHELVLVNLHLEAYDSGEGKVAQTAMLRSFLEQEYEKGNYVIAGGDFNQTFSSIDTDAFPVHEGMWLPGTIDVADFPAGWQLLMDDRTASCRSLDRPYAADMTPDEFQFYIIDGFIASPNVEVLRCTTVQADFAATDHNPVQLVVRLGAAL